MTTKADTTRTITMPNYKATQHAGILLTIAVETIERDVAEAMFDSGRVSTALQLAAELSGLDYETLFDAAVEGACANRTMRDRRWMTHRGLTAFDRDALTVPTPKYDAVQRSLRGY